MIKLHLITPGFRPAFIQKNIEYLISYRNYPFTWHLIMDNKINLDISKLKGYNEIKDFLNFCSIETKFTYGFEQRNHFTEHLSLDYSPEDWCYFLDDDNLVTPDIFTAFEKYKFDNTAKVILMSQIRYDNPLKKILGKPGHEKLGLVDIGSFLYRNELLRGFRFSHFNNYSEDGALIQNLFSTYSDFFKYEEGLVTTYNVLKA